MGSMRILIKGGKVVNDDFTHEADVYIENGIIQQVSLTNALSLSATQAVSPAANSLDGKVRFVEKA